MANPIAKIGWKVIGGAAAAAAGSLAGKAVTSAYMKVRKHGPPIDPRHPDTSWTDAIGWAVVSGVAIGVGRLAAQRAVARGWVKATGSLPPGMAEHAED